VKLLSLFKDRQVDSGLPYTIPDKNYIIHTFKSVRFKIEKPL